MAQALRRARRGWPKGPFPQAENPASVDDLPQGRLQGQMLPRPIEEARVELRGHLGQDGLVRVPDVLFHRAPPPQEAGGVQALRNQPQKALQEIPHAAVPRRQMADGREVRPLGMPVAQATRRQILLPVHRPRRGQQETLPLVRRRALHVRVRPRHRRRDRVLRLRAQDASDRQRHGVHGQNVREAGLKIREGGTVPPRFLLPKARDPAQAHQAQDARAQRQGGTEPQDRPGEVLPDAFLLLPRGPEGTGGEVDEAVQLDPQDGAWLEDAGPGRVCKAPRVDVNYG